MLLNEFAQLILSIPILANATFTDDEDGQIIIHTGLKILLEGNFLDDPKVYPFEPLRKPFMVDEV